MAAHVLKYCDLWAVTHKTKGYGSICEHGWRRGACKECGVVSYASTSMEDLVGYSCGVCKVRECVCPLDIDGGSKPCMYDGGG